MNATELVRQYLDASDPSRLQLDRLRSLLADDFTIADPLVDATSADDFVDKLRTYGSSPGMENTIEAVIGEGERVAALTRLAVAGETITYCMWFVVRGDKIKSVLVVYDPRPFLKMAGGA